MKALLSLLVSLPFWATAARLFPCSNYTEAGQPQGVYETWEVPENGAAIYLLYRAEGNRLALPQSLGIRWRPLGGRGAVDFKPFDQIYNFTASGEDWLVFDYTFKEAGVYECSALDANDKPLATAIVTINAAQQKPVGAAHLAVCKDVNKSGNPVGASNDFSLPTGAGLYALFSTDGPFNTDRLGFEIWRVDEFGYETFIETKAFECETNWNYFKMPYFFNESGRYKIKVFLGTDNTKILTEQMVRLVFK